MNTTKITFEVDRREICYFRFTLESYDGLAQVSTVDPHRALIEVSVAPGCEKWLMGLMDALKRNEGLSVSLPD